MVYMLRVVVESYQWNLNSDSDRGCDSRSKSSMYSIRLYFTTIP